MRKVRGVKLRNEKEKEIINKIIQILNKTRRRVPCLIF
ncbi:hypothetical protein Mcup_1012 [Metallosphaera cuprina Ar-4]|uniref:Uncharacterized protein n=1 Tax=Metallosphaera cuprina (strain Ar-4) TaxID=1006006 RepID=F4G2R9_METCR|nr:hypothetical protein Mcup_1012 [Metallosphaera cuprina Ar-4]